MLTAGFDLLAIMQAGGWKTPEIVARYVEHANTRAMHERRWRVLQSCGQSVMTQAGGEPPPTTQR
jgi:hypothetical protein